MNNTNITATTELRTDKTRNTNKGWRSLESGRRIKESGAERWLGDGGGGVWRDGGGCRGGGGCYLEAGASGRVMGVGEKGKEGKGAWVADGGAAVTAARWGCDRGGGQWRWREGEEGRRRKKGKEEGGGVAAGLGGQWGGSGQ
nr:ctenidin-3-like [Arachis hypogaea]